MILVGCNFKRTPGTNPMSSYVAFTRVKKKEDLLIFRPFDRDLFNRGDLEGPLLLLKLLRGEPIDWDAIEAKHMPSHMCIGCDVKHFKADFSEKQWRRQQGTRYCKTCEQNLSENGTHTECFTCGHWQRNNMCERGLLL